MKFILFCENPYAFGILAPIRAVLEEKKHTFLWYVTDKICSDFPYQDDAHTNSITNLDEFSSDAILVPGNEVPYNLRGLKVQIFHGLAGEKKGHFKIRHYFDLYLTQGPYFTNAFKKLSEKYKDFDVIETGWSKLDDYSKSLHEFDAEKEALLKEHNAKRIVLYAPTFSPSLTSAPQLKNELEKLAQNLDYLILIKFHDLMANDLVETYKSIADKYRNIQYIENHNILKCLLLSDLMISDTSSVVYEFLLLNKPVITFNTRSPKDAWENSNTYTHLSERVNRNFEQDPLADKRAEIIANYHPYQDGKSSERMVKAIEEYIQRYGVPERRKLSLFRKFKMRKMYK